MAPNEQEMRDAAETAAALVQPGMHIGLGTGRTVAFLLPAIAARGIENLRCVATSPETESAAGALGIPVEPFDQLDRLDLAIDGADQVTQDRWAIKGGHGAQLREKIVAAAADRFIVIVSSDKVVEALHPPVPLELERFGLAATLRAVAPTALRPDAAVTPDGGVLGDYQGAIDDRQALARRFEQTPGVMGHGLFGPALIHRVIVGGATGGTT